MNTTAQHIRLDWSCLPSKKTIGCCCIFIIYFSADTDECLLKLDSGVEMAFRRAKVLSKYLGELISFAKKRAHLGKL